MSIAARPTVTAKRSLLRVTHRGHVGTLRQATFRREFSTLARHQQVTLDHDACRNAVRATVPSWKVRTGRCGDFAYAAGDRTQAPGALGWRARGRGIS